MTISRAVTVAAMLLFTASASAQESKAPAKPGPSGADTAPRIGILGGFEFEDDTGFGLRGDWEIMPLKMLDKGTLKLMGSLGWTYFSENDVSANVFRLIPGVRYVYPLQDRLGLYADGGLGLYYANVSVDDDLLVDDDDSETSLLIRFAGGGFYELSPSLRIVGEIGLMPHFGDFDITPFTLFGGVSFTY